MTNLDDDVLVWLRMGDDDRERYGGPEWVRFDVAELYNAPASLLAAYEAEIGFAIHWVLREYASYGARAVRAALFIARRRAGVQRDGRDERWSEFDPRTNQVKHRDEPPADATPTTPEPSGPGKRRSGAKSGASPDGSEGAASPKSSTTSAQS